MSSPSDSVGTFESAGSGMFESEGGSKMFKSDYALAGFGDEVIVFLVVLVAVVAVIVSYVFTAFQTSSMASSTTTDSQEPSAYEGRLRTGQHDCSICLGETFLAVETNCNHSYCGECFFTYYTMANTGPLTAPTCPYCRTRLTMIMPYFSESERHSAELDVVEKRTDLLEKIRAYNRRFSGTPRTFGELLSDIPMLLRHLWSLIWSGEGIHIIFRIRIFILAGFAFLYILSPFDIIPEVAFGIFGLLDDLLIFGLFVMYATILFRNFVAAQS